DGGDYEIVATATNRVEWRRTVTVPADSGKVSVEIPKLAAPERQPIPTPSKPMPLEHKPEPIKIEKHETPEPSTWSTKRPLATGVGVVALASLGTGIGLGIVAKQRERQALDLCMEGVQCEFAPQARTLNLQGHHLATAANVLFGVSGLASIGAVILWVTGAPV